MYATRILLALLVLGAAACGSDTTSPEPTIAPVYDGSPIMGSGGKSDSTSTTNPDSTTTSSGG